MRECAGPLLLCVWEGKSRSLIGSSQPGNFTKKFLVFCGECTKFQKDKNTLNPAKINGFRRKKAVVKCPVLQNATLREGDNRAILDTYRSRAYPTQRACRGTNRLRFFGGGLPGGSQM